MRKEQQEDAPTLRTAPSTLTDEVSLASSTSERFTSNLAQNSLRLDNRPFSFVKDTQYLRPQLELSTSTRRRKRSVELDLPPAVDHSFVVELRYAWYWLGIGQGIEIDDFLI